MSLTQQAQSLKPDALVSLFTLNTTPIGGPVLRFVQDRHTNGDPIYYGGVPFVPVDVEFDGLEISGQGSFPTPHVRLANTDGIFQTILQTYGDVIGCSLTRMRTYARFLDGGSEADPNAYYGPDTFRVERRVDENPVFIEWELSTAIDQEGKMLPGRQVIRDTCLWRYRTWDTATGAWDYSQAFCPYTGSTYYDINDEVVTDPTKDVPSRRRSCCETRFGKGNPLPFGGFPGAARVRA
jgi:lambda family phage minor tail protein L